MSQPIIRIENLGKRYVVDHEARRRACYRTLRETLVDLATAPLRRLTGEGRTIHEEFWALRDVNYELHPGRVLGIIGRNGAGKSTLLKILSRITKPTTGRVELNGRVGSLLEVGTGFHAELTGRENIYLNGSILGMPKQEIDRKFDEIVDFAGVEKFIDTPVKRYSSGMFVRLGFAVAAHLEPETLIVDEVLSVGDAEFQRKCLGKMQSVAKGGRTVIVVSHNIPTLEALCEDGLWLQNGLIRASGPMRSLLDQYERCVATTGADDTENDLKEHSGRRTGCTPLFKRITIMDESGTRHKRFGIGDKLRVDLHFEGRFPLHKPTFAVGIDDAHGRRLVTIDSSVQGEAISLPTTTCGVASITTDVLQLVPGRYYLTPLVVANSVTDIIDAAIDFEIVPRDFFGTGKLPNAQQGCFLMHGQFNVVAC